MKIQIKDAEAILSKHLGLDVDIITSQAYSAQLTSIPGNTYLPTTTPP